jgi:gas vesicle protein
MHAKNITDFCLMEITSIIKLKTDTMENSNDSLKVIGALLLGAVVGGTLGILFAPAKGTVTRKKIAGKSEDMTDAIKEKFDDFLEEIKEEIEMVKHKANDFMKDGAAKTEKTK